MVTENKIVCYYSDNELRSILEQREAKRLQEYKDQGYVVVSGASKRTRLAKFEPTPHTGAVAVGIKHAVYTPGGTNLGTITFQEL